MNYNGTGAFQDIIGSDRFKGAIDSIQWLTSILDNFFVQIISIAGFLIISVALLKNVLSGLYCVAPKFFDRIHVIKSNLSQTAPQWAGGNGFGGGPGMAGAARKGSGIALWVVSLLIPDVRAIIDIDDDDAAVIVMDPKKYFTTALIQGVIMVIIGVVVYNGLYRDIIARGADLGVHVIETYVAKVNFVESFDNIMQAGKDFTFTFGDSTEGKRKTDLAKKIYNELKGMVPDANSTEARSNIGTAVQNQVEQIYSESLAFWGGTDPWNSGDFKFSFQILAYGTNVPKNISAYKVNTNMEYQYAVESNLQMLGVSDSRAVQEGTIKLSDLILIRVRFERLSTKTNNALGSLTGTMSITAAQGTNDTRNANNKSITIQVTQGIFGSFSNATTYSCNGESITIAMSGSTLKLTGFSTALSGVQTFTHSAGTVGTWNGIIIQSFTLDLSGISASGTLSGTFNVSATSEYEAKTFNDLTSQISVADFKLKGSDSE